MNVDYGLCHCGCGESTTISTRNDSRRGSVIGLPRKYVANHHKKRRGHLSEPFMHEGENVRIRRTDKGGQGDR